MDKQSVVGYFDYNATTPLSESVANKMMSSLWVYCNASSSSSAAQQGKRLLAEARENVGRLLNCAAEQVAFTSGGSEANNWAIKSNLLCHATSPGHIITTAIEHPSVLDTLRYLEESFGFDVTYLAPRSDGAITVEDVETALRNDTQLISVMYANNETGVIQPVAEIAALARAHGIMCHTDCVQVIGKRALDISALGVDFASFSAHKFYGPKGVGGLYIRSPHTLQPLIHGGGQEMGLRAGTENLLAITGLSQAAQDCCREVVQWDAHYTECKAYLIEALEAVDLDIVFNGTTQTHRCVANTVNFSVLGVRGEALAAFLDKKYGIVVSIGSACSNNNTAKKLSHVLTSMGCDDERIQSAIRVSFGRYTTVEDIRRFVDSLERCASKLLAISMM